MSKNNLNKIPIISFFSGGGFMDIGFEQSNFEVKWTNEFDNLFAQLYSAGVTSWRKSVGYNVKAEINNTNSITDIKSKDILKEAFPDGRPKCFGVIGGPPCQDFSINGSMAGFKGERGRLTIVFFDKILELKPTFFIMENVTGLIKKKETRNFLQSLIIKIQKDYYIDCEILNSLEFCVPQHRERLFYIGIRKEYLNKDIINRNSLTSWFTFPSNEKYKNASIKFNWGKRSEFGKKISKPKNVPIELCVENCLVPDNSINKVANANEYFNLYLPNSVLSKINEGETNRPSFKRLHRFKYSPTTCYGNNEVHLHPYKNRRLSVREALRIQGVPDSYELPRELSLSKKFKMIGNGVPVPLAKAVADSLYSFLREHRIV